jgi:ubiquinone/menaquinone biosynthesis C-methylase UbiE/DNA-binding transcriptional ArsR family regulator
MTRTPRQPDALLAWMECLADPARLRLLRLLERNELGVAELTDVLQMPQSTVSRHLKILSDQRFVRSRRQGTTHLYQTILDELDAPARKLWLVAREQTDDWPAVRQDQLRLSRLLREKQDDAQSFFAGAAAEWDKLRSELYGNHFPLAAALSLISPHTIVADLGCGTGQLVAMLAPYVRRTIGVDNSAPMLKAARKRTADSANVTLYRGELESLPIESETCDAAMMVLSLIYVASPSLALSEMSRILKPKGRAIVVDLLPHSREDFRRQYGQQHLGFADDQVTNFFTESGFTNVGITNLAPEEGVKGPALFLATASRA